MHLVNMSVRCHFRVVGKVQGVFFRKYTKLKADSLSVSGWCRNEQDGISVSGELSGSPSAVDAMIRWLSTEGSPKSIIHTCDITDRAEVNEMSRRGRSFEIRT